MGQHAARKGAPTNDDVLVAVRGLLAAEGRTGLSVRRVAAVLEVSRQVVYSRFGSKQGLLRALYVDGFQRLGARVRAAPGVPGDDDHVVALARAYLEHAETEPEVYRIMFAGGFDPDPAAYRVAEQAFSEIVRCARAWLKSNTEQSRGALSLARALWAGTHGIVSLLQSGHLTPRQARTEASALVRRVLRGSTGPAAS